MHHVICKQYGHMGDTYALCYQIFMVQVSLGGTCQQITHLIRLVRLAFSAEKSTQKRVAQTFKISFLFV